MGPVSVLGDSLVSRASISAGCLTRVWGQYQCWVTHSCLEPVSVLGDSLVTGASISAGCLTRAWGQYQCWVSHSCLGPVSVPGVSLVTAASTSSGCLTLGEHRYCVYCVPVPVPVVVRDCGYCWYWVSHSCLVLARLRCAHHAPLAR